MASFKEIREKITGIVSMICGAALAMSGTVGIIFPEFYINNQAPSPVLLGMGITIMQGKYLSRKLVEAIASFLNNYVEKHKENDEF